MLAFLFYEKVTHYSYIQDRLLGIFRKRDTKISTKILKGASAMV